jgi:hypothetical protein
MECRSVRVHRGPAQVSATAGKAEAGMVKGRVWRLQQDRSGHREYIVSREAWSDGYVIADVESGSTPTTFPPNRPTRTNQMTITPAIHIALIQMTPTRLPYLRDSRPSHPACQIRSHWIGQA